MAEENITKTSEIKVQIGLNDNNLPIRMKWTATDGNVDNQEARAMLYHCGIQMRRIP